MAKKRQSSGPVSAPRPGWLEPVAAALLGVATFGLYTFSFGNGLTNWDDPDYLTHSPFVQAGWAGVGKAFTQTYDGAYYPLTHSLYAIANALGFGTPQDFHLLQALLFAATVALVPRALRAFGVPGPAGFAAALIWAVHPFRVESVVWVANLKDTLGAFFVVLAFALEAGQRRLGALGSFAAALLSKSVFFPLALVFPLAAWARGEALLPALKRSAPHLVLAAAAAIFGAIAHLALPANHDGRPLLTAIATAAWTPWWYLGRTLLPLGSRAVYDFELVQPASLRFGAALILWALALVTLWKLKRREAWLAAGVYVLALAPVSGLVPLTYLVADRYTLFPSLALFAGLAVLALRFGGNRALVALGAVSLALAPMNVWRQREWTDSVTLWEANAKWAHPWAVHANLSNAYGLLERWDDAARELASGLVLRPDRRDAIGQLFFFEGAKDQVEPTRLFQLRADIDRAHADAPSLIAAARWCATHRGLDAARVALEHVPSLSTDGAALRVLSDVERRQSHPAEAVTQARAAIALGEQGARIELVYALADGGQFDEALREAGYAFDDPVTAAQLKAARGYALTRMGREQEGAAEVDAAARELQALTGSR